jgi:hypothetical protein
MEQIQIPKHMSKNDFMRSIFEANPNKKFSKEELEGLNYIWQTQQFQMIRKPPK